MAKLTLIPTPIDEENPLEQTAFSLLEDAVTHKSDKSVIVIEDLKPGRRRWLRWGLPRSAVESFVEYNEHTALEVSEQLIRDLKAHKDVYLMSDGGLPGFCDPGRLLIKRCHELGIQVTSTPFPNSISLAVAMSGIVPGPFYFAGFLPRREGRKEELRSHFKSSVPVVIMDTPYRLSRVLDEIIEINNSAFLFLALDLNSSEELLLSGNASQLKKKLGKNTKREFILIVGKPLH